MPCPTATCSMVRDLVGEGAGPTSLNAGTFRWPREALQRKPALGQRQTSCFAVGS